MGYQQKIWNGNLMGDQGSDRGVKPSKKNPPGDGKNFKVGKVLNGLNAHDDSSFPKAGRGQADGFQWMRDSKIAKGSI